ncbi:MAG: 50S ribosomal protein L23 [Thermoplasmataceae archaeon]|uniref:Ribosomal protein L23 n=1 Tax=mine drainage metagenome TaxID=410659 RepID=T0ZL01_9ZZZZ
MKFNIISPVATEKTMLKGEKENKLTFIVKREATKKDIQKEVEERFGVKVLHVNTSITKKGKKATVRLSSEFTADEVGGRIGIY